MEAKTGTYTLTDSDYAIVCTGTFTVTLPPLTSNLGRSFIIKNEGTGVITLDGDGAETIDDETTQELYENDGVQVIASATQWNVV